MASVIDTADWAAAPGEWRGEIELGRHGANLCLIFNLANPGEGPRLHRHHYAETFIIRSGRAHFTIGDANIEATTGQIVVVPAGVPHKFINPGPDMLATIDIHEAGSFDTEWLE